MKGQIDTQYGKVLVEDDVIATYAGSVAVECFGIVGMASVNVKDGMAKLLKRENVSRGVNVTVIDNKIHIELHVIVAYGVSIRAVAQNILENVRCRVETYTGMEVESISVAVEGVRIVDD